MKAQINHTFLPINVLLADDDQDDRFFFKIILEEIPIPTQLVSVTNGEKILKHLYSHTGKLPDIIFLDFNMPCMNGMECLKEIKHKPVLNHIPVIMYSTSFHEKTLNLLYDLGVSYCIRKSYLKVCRGAISSILNRLLEKNLVQPSRNEFIINP